MKKPPAPQSDPPEAPPAPIAFEHAMVAHGPTFNRRHEVMSQDSMHKEFWRFKDFYADYGERLVRLEITVPEGVEVVVGTYRRQQ